MGNIHNYLRIKQASDWSSGDDITHRQWHKLGDPRYAELGDSLSPTDKLIDKYLQWDAADNDQRYMNSYLKYNAQQAPLLEEAFDKVNAGMEAHKERAKAYNERAKAYNENVGAKNKNIDNFNNNLTKKYRDLNYGARIDASTIGGGLGLLGGALGGEYLSRRLGLRNNPKRKWADRGVRWGTGLGGAALGAWLGSKTVDPDYDLYDSLDTYSSAPIYTDPLTKTSSYSLRKYASSDDDRIDPPTDPGLLMNIPHDIGYDTAKYNILNHYYGDNSLFNDFPDQRAEAMQLDAANWDAAIKALDAENAKLAPEYWAKRKAYDDRKNQFYEHRQKLYDNRQKLKDDESRYDDNERYNYRNERDNKSKLRHNAFVDNMARNSAVYAYGRLGSGVGTGLGALAGAGLGYWGAGKLGLRDAKNRWKRYAGYGLTGLGALGGATIGDRLGGNIGRSVSNALLRKPVEVGGINGYDPNLML